MLHDRTSAVIDDTSGARDSRGAAGRIGYTHSGGGRKAGLNGCRSGRAAQAVLLDLRMPVLTDRSPPPLSIDGGTAPVIALSAMDERSGGQGDEAGASDYL